MRFLPKKVVYFLFGQNRHLPGSPESYRNPPAQTQANQPHGGWGRRGALPRAVPPGHCWIEGDAHGGWGEKDPRTSGQTEGPQGIGRRGITASVAAKSPLHKTFTARLLRVSYPSHDLGWVLSISCLGPGKCPTQLERTSSLAPNYGLGGGGTNAEPVHQQSLATTEFNPPKP